MGYVNPKKKVVVSETVQFVAMVIANEVNSANKIVKSIQSAETAYVKVAKA